MKGEVCLPKCSFEPHCVAMYAHGATLRFGIGLLDFVISNTLSMYVGKWPLLDENGAFA